MPGDRLEEAFGESAVSRLFADYDRLSPDGPGHRGAIWERMQVVWAEQPDISRDSLSAITCPALAMAADRDVVSIEHTTAIRDAISGSRLCIVPGATHMLLEA